MSIFERKIETERQRGGGKETERERQTQSQKQRRGRSEEKYRDDGEKAAFMGLWVNTETLHYSCYFSVFDTI
jgi:hypothetical protein